MAKIEIRDLYKVFGPAPEQALAMLRAGQSKQDIFAKTGNAIGLDNIAFDVMEGEVLVIMGLSGSGKSTLIRCINRLFEPSAGSIVVDGEDVMTLDNESLRRFRRDKFGMVFQQFALLPHRTVLANVEFGLEIQQRPAEQRTDKARQALHMVGLAGWEEAYPHQLSGGMQQRVGLARALAVDPDIMLMDEAFSALDPLIRRDMQDELLDLQARMHKTILFVSHDLDEAVKIGDRIILMKDGAIVQVGTPEAILTSPADSYVAQFVGDVNLARVLTAGSILTPAKPIAHLDETPASVRQKVEAVNYSSILVVDAQDKLVGLIHHQDLQQVKDKPAVSLQAIMQTDFPRVTPQTPLPELYRLFADWPDALPVVDQHHRLVGVVRKTNIMQALSHETENGNGEDPQVTAG